MKQQYVSDMEINRIVSVVFVRHQINLRGLSHHTCRGMVAVQGKLDLLPGTSTVLTPSMVGALFDEIGRSRGVHGLNIELRNWRFDGGKNGWRQVRDVMRLRPVGSSCPGLNVFEIPDKEISEFASMSNKARLRPHSRAVEPRWPQNGAAIRLIRPAVNPLTAP